MEKNSPLRLPEVILPDQNSKKISGLLKKGLIRKIAPRIYTSNLEAKDEEIVKRNIWHIIGKLYPGAILSHRTAIEFKPTSNGSIFVTYLYTKSIKLPGITLRLLEGQEHLPDDHLFTDGLYVSQLERALLENLQVSRRSGPDSKALAMAVLEEKLEEIIRVKGESALNEVRDKARDISSELNMQEEYNRLTKIISSLLSTKPSNILKSPQALARAVGYPYDPDRINLFADLHNALIKTALPDHKDQNLSRQAFRNFAFFEAYFSNYIEGTIFEIEEAKQIIETGIAIPNRAGDSHDISGTYKVVSDPMEMSIVPDSWNEWIDIMKYRHAIIMGGRPDKSPGNFKNINNRAGETFFVDHSLVTGTLKAAFDFYRNLQHPLAKAMYMMFVISEIHPFLDGNGRLARIMMNAELVTKGYSKILIPTVYRDDYMGALRRLTRQRDTLPYIKMMSRIYAFSHNINGENFDDMESKLVRSNAFKDPDEARLIF